MFIQPGNSAAAESSAPPGSRIDSEPEGRPGPLTGVGLVGAAASSTHSSVTIVDIRALRLRASLTTVGGEQQGARRHSVWTNLNTRAARTLRPGPRLNSEPA